MHEASATRDGIAILVGPNGSGKSNFLQSVAREYRHTRSIAIISNTAFDRFSGMRAVNRISTSKGVRTPESIIKQAITQGLEFKGSEMFELSAIMEYCGYQPRFGFSIERLLSADDPYSASWYYRRGYAESAINSESFRAAEEIINKLGAGKVLWVDSRSSRLEFSFQRDFQLVLQHEELLKQNKLIKKVNVHLQRNDGVEIQLKAASSGELSLISSLIFLITSVDRNALILIDEPENSLHPAWQREYVDRLLIARTYRNISVIIATHAPLLVTGALTKHPDLVSIFHMGSSGPYKLEFDGALHSAKSIEEVLWKAFDVVTPANHFISEHVARLLGKYEQGQVTKDNILWDISTLENESFDERQKGFFLAIRNLIDQIEQKKENDRLEGSNNS